MKKGSISIETIIIIILALLVLVIVAAAFSGGMAELWKKIISISEPTKEISRAEAVTKCTSLCATAEKSVYDTTSFIITGEGAKNCRELYPC